jgi:hypothetical protein
MRKPPLMPSASQSEERSQISIRLTPDLYSDLSRRAQETGLSMNRTVLQILRVGLDAERDKKQRLQNMLQRYRQCSDPEEAQRLGDELGEMIFGR